MLGLYFFGPPLEKLWGARNFILFYLICGLCGGLSFLALAGVLASFFDYPQLLWAPLVGASGGILGCLAACAILFPHFIILIFPIRWVAGFFVVLYAMTVVFEHNLGDAAHLGGMVAAGAWILAGPALARLFRARLEKMGRGAWQRRMDRMRRRQEELDGILDKIRRDGIASLSSSDKKKLKEATRLQDQQDREINRH